jgi:hypothetical protein
MINLHRAVALATTAAALALGAFTAPASAATQNAAPGPSGVTHGATVTHSGNTTITYFTVGDSALTADSVSPNFMVCQVKAYTYVGQTICDTVGFAVTHDGGHQETFIIGKDWGIWHAWPGSNGWHTLGGQALHFTGTDSGVFFLQDNPLVIWVWGTDGNPWCNIWGAPWSGWFLCG